MNLSPAQIKLLDNYLEKIIEINKTTNLTRIDTKESAQLLHIEDSLVGLPEFLEAPDGPYADLGSGGGFPGVPLAIVSNRPVLLVDSVKKKMKLIQDTCNTLGLGELVSTYAGRIEDLSIEQRNHYSVLTARALTALPSLLELSSPLLSIGGVLIAYKASAAEEEIASAKPILAKLGMRLVSQRSVTLSDGETHREILVYKKVANASMKLPRRVGMAQKKPLR